MEYGEEHGGQDSNSTLPNSLTCLMLGKRGRCRTSDDLEDVPRCQVDGCHVGLEDAKEYHRRHKVCEAHSKATHAVVVGENQRFCQQCSRFHYITEFDDSKRSCRRRLAGHNQRRRKCSQPKNPSQGEIRLTMSQKCTSSAPTECVRTLLSSTFDSHVNYQIGLSTRSSAALQDLIAENRARQLTMDRDYWPLHRHTIENQLISGQSGGEYYNDEDDGSSMSWNSYNSVFHH